MSDEPSAPAQPPPDIDDPETKSLIEKLYGISIDDIRQLKNRQWDVTKWVLAANVALFIPIAIGEWQLPTCMLYAIAALSLLLGFLAGFSILKTQRSLQLTRQILERYRDRHAALKDAHACGEDPEPKKPKPWFDRPDQDSFCYDWQIWLPMLIIVLMSAVATMLAAITAQPSA